MESRSVLLMKDGKQPLVQVRLSFPLCLCPVAHCRSCGNQAGLKPVSESGFFELVALVDKPVCHGLRWLASKPLSNMVKKWLKCGFALKKSGFEHGKKDAQAYCQLSRQAIFKPLNHISTT